ncbi:MAG: hypothetical protein HY434_00045 [Candidatus Liptonbacteria bacterium]|nr:hypothetical protein [Candidatus Liptonbacteria bacterium]
MEYKSNKGFAPIIIIIFAALIFGGGAAYYAKRAKIRPIATVCTAEQKQCPDGSYVSRMAPSCEFEKCPAWVAEESASTPENIKVVPPGAASTSGVLPPAAAQDKYADWEKYQNLKYGFFLKYPKDHTPYARLDGERKTLVSADAFADVIMVAENEQALFSAPAQAVVLKIAMVNEDMRLDDWVDRNLSKYVLAVNGISRKNRTVAGKAAVEITQQAQGINSPHKIIVIQPGNFFVVITESAPNNLLDQIFGTFKFIN